MFIYEAAALLKNVTCPHCKKDVQLGMKCPFVLFDALELNDSCSTKECSSFYQEMKTLFKSYKSGQIKESDIQLWLDNYKKEDIQ